MFMSIFQHAKIATLTNTSYVSRLRMSIVLGMLVHTLTQLLKNTAETNSQHPPNSQSFITVHNVCSFYISFCEHLLLADGNLPGGSVSNSTLANHFHCQVI